MTFSITILGSNSAIPTLLRNPSAQLLNVNERLFLIDCAEGTQLQFRKYKIKYQKINHIFISHLHGDHYFGLIGLLFTYHLLGRRNELHIYAAKEIEQIINIQLEASRGRLQFPVIYHPLEPEKSELIIDDNLLTVRSFPLKHRIPTWGFIFKEKKKPRNIKKEIIEQEEIPFASIKKIKLGNNYINPEGKVFKNTDITIAPQPQRSYAYCSDTAYHEQVIPFITGIDMLYHEATFMENMSETATEKYHSTAKQAANIARKAKVKKLLIGHFSARYDDPISLLDEAKTVFENCELANDGSVFEI